VLHAHLPFVRHPEHSEFLEERWLFEAMTESYLPLLDRCSAPRDEQVPFRLTMSITPTLLAMLSDPLLQTRYVKHLEAADRAGRQGDRADQMSATVQPPRAVLPPPLCDGRHWFVDVYKRNLIQAFGSCGTGMIELLASSATHAFLRCSRNPTRQCARRFRSACRRPTGVW